MNWPVIADLVTAAFALATVVLLRPLLRYGGAAGMAATFTAGAFWAVGHAIAAVSTVPWVAYGGLVLAIAGSAAAGAFTVVSAYGYAYPSRPVPRWALVLLSVGPMFVTIMAATNPLHHLYWSGVRLYATTGLPTETVAGPFQIVALALFGAATTGWGLTLIIGAGSRGGRVLRVQSWVLMLVAVTPGLGIMGKRLIDPMLFGAYSPSVLVIASAIGVAFATRRLRLFELTPTVLEDFVRHMPLGLLTFDIEQRVIDMNETARRLLTPDTPHTNATISELFASWTGASERDLELIEGGDPILVSKDGRYLSVRLWSHSDRAGNALGRALLIDDVTEEHLGMATLAEVSNSLAHWSEELGTFRTILADARAEARRQP